MREVQPSLNVKPKWILCLISTHNPNTHAKFYDDNWKIDAVIDILCILGLKLKIMGVGVQMGSYHTLSYQIETAIMHFGNLQVYAYKKITGSINPPVWYQ